MTVGDVKVERLPERPNWFRVTITSLPDSVGQTVMELLMREESLRAIRNGADYALSNKNNPNPLDALREDK